MNLTKTSALVGLTAVLVGCSAATTVPTTSAPTGATSSASGATCSYETTGDASKPVNQPPTSGIANTGTVDYVVKLNGSDVGLTLNRAAAPCAVNSFISLAEQGFYDQTSCHRMAAYSGFEMLQCGDPTGTGMGGPGYQFAEELTGAETYGAGTLAMARTSQPTSQGSQFFLVFGDTQLAPEYTVFGTIDAAGLKVIQKIGAGGTDNSQGSGVGKPKTPAVITSVKPR